MNAKEVIRVRGISKRFGEIVAVDQADFSVREGEILGFLGPNGAGKTTTIRMLVGLLLPDLLGKGLGAALFGLAMGLITLVFVVLIFGLSAADPFFLAIGMVLSCFAFAFLGILISVGVREVFQTMTLSNFFRFPMIFFCGVFFPVASMPAVLQAVGYALPLTYTGDIFRQSLLAQTGLLPRWLDILILAGFSLFLFEAAATVFKKRNRT